MSVAFAADAPGARAPEKKSLVVAARDVVPSDGSDSSHATGAGDDLVPIAQSSDHTPQLATVEEESSSRMTSARGLSQAGDAEAGVSNRSIRPASVDEPLLKEPVQFQGILVGTSTKQDVLTAWGEPADSVATNEGTVLAYDIEPFQSVEVLIGADEQVSAIKVAVAAPLEPKYLAEQLSLNNYRPVTAKDEADHPLGQVFPERGVLFMFQASEADALAADGKTPPAVSHVVLQRLDPLAFAMRAEECLHGPYAQNIADLKSALEIDPNCARAHWLLAQIYTATGEADLADAAARSACDADPENATYQLWRGRTQQLIGEYDSAVLTVRAVLDREDITQMEHAQALHQMGCLASLGDVEIASKAIGFHTRAIEIADQLATSAIAEDRRAAKQLLVEAHMAVAEEIARQSFNQKVENLSLWVGRASGLAEEFVANDGGSIELRLLIAQRALAALGSFRPTLDPAPWVAEAQEAADALFAQSDDELWQARIKWELGIAYLNALRVEHVRRETQNALKFGDFAVEHLAQGAATRQAVHSAEQIIGQLYFQVGAVHAVHQLDHVKAAQWYDKAEPLLLSKCPPSELYAPRREGEMLVSIGVTYWQIGEQQRALELTQTGVNLVEEAVEAGILPRSTLSVPYGNLATMYQKVGASKQAARYAELARSASGKSVSVARGAGGGDDVRQASGSVGSSARRSRGETMLR